MDATQFLSKRERETPAVNSQRNLKAPIYIDPQLSDGQAVYFSIYS